MMRVRVETETTDESGDGLVPVVDCEDDLATLQSLLTGGRIEEARCLVVEILQRWPQSDLVQRFARVLAPPVARVVEGKRGLTREQSRKSADWLRDNAGDYSGCWVILQEDRLLAAHPRLREAIEEADREGGPGIGSVHYIPRRDIDS